MSGAPTQSRTHAAKKWGRRLGFLLLCAGGAALLLQRDDDDALKVSTHTHQHDHIDAIGKHLMLHRFDDQGVLKHTMYSSASEHYAVSKETHFVSPVIITNEQYSSDDDNPEDGWQISAQTGIADDANEHVTLKDKVIAKPSQGRPTSLEAVTITTEQLDYHTIKGIVMTDLPVRIESDQSVTTAIGMTLDINQQTLTLHQRVKSRYDPNILAP